MSLQTIKQRFGIIGDSDGLNRALEKTISVAPTDISLLITGESGVGKEVIPKIAHQLSNRKHSKLIAVNCGAIPEGTIDSELFGHEKGAFTGATQTRQGYFEVADGGTIFLDEVGELPLTSQVRLLRILENGEFIKVGSSKVQKTNVRIIAATNVNMSDAIRKNKFREDLYYRLSTVEINLPPLRERLNDIHILFRKFCSDFAHKYNMPSIKLDNDAIGLLTNYRWSGNIRQLKNIAEQLSILEEDRNITKDILVNYLPKYSFLFLIFALAALGLPGTSGFLGEFLVLTGTFQKSYLAAMLATFGVVLGAAYMLWLTKRVIFGTANNSEIKNLNDINKSEIIMLVSLAFLIIFFGFYPLPLMETFSVSVNSLINNYQTALTSN